MEAGWSLLAIPLVALVGGFLAGATALALGGGGAIRNLAKRLDHAEDGIERIDSKLTSEIKRRVGAKGVEARRSAADIQDEAAQRIIDGNQGPAAPRRPSIVGR